MLDPAQDTTLDARRWTARWTLDITLEAGQHAAEYVVTLMSALSRNGNAPLHLSATHDLGTLPRPQVTVLVPSVTS